MSPRLSTGTSRSSARWSCGGRADATVMRSINSGWTSTCWTVGGPSSTPSNAPCGAELSRREAAAGSHRADTQDERTLQNQLDRVQARLGADAGRRGQIAALRPADHHLAVLGPVPVDPFEQLDWQERAQAASISTEPPTRSTTPPTPSVLRQRQPNPPQPSDPSTAPAGTRLSPHAVGPEPTRALSVEAVGADHEISW